jgi:hypothetical protein
MAKFNAENAMKVVKKGERTIPSEPIDKGETVQGLLFP